MRNKLYAVAMWSLIIFVIAAVIGGILESLCYCGGFFIWVALITAPIGVISAIAGNAAPSKTPKQAFGEKTVRSEIERARKEWLRDHWS